MPTLTEIKEALTKAAPRFGKLIPPGAGVTAEEIVVGAMKAIAESTAQADPKRRLDTCTTTSIILAVSNAASLGLVPGVADDGWLIGRDNNKAGKGKKPIWVRECQWMTGVRGIIRLVWMNPRVASISCEVVHQRDEFVYTAGDNPTCTHKHARGERGPVECAYFVVIWKDGTTSAEKMDLEDLEKARGVSQMADFGAWKIWTNQMYRKCVAHRAMKWLPLSPKIRAVLDQDAMMQSAREAEQRIEIGSELADAAQVKAAKGEGVGYEELIERMNADGSTETAKVVKQQAAKRETQPVKAEKPPPVKEREPGDESEFGDDGLYLESSDAEAAKK